MYLSLEKLLVKLKTSPRVRGIFLTGSTATKMSPSSDIDFVVILDRNTENIDKIYTTIENRFSDIFFFDVDFLNRLNDTSDVSGNTVDGMFIDWLLKGKIEYDPENLLSSFKSKITETPPVQKVADSEKRDFWAKTNYNFIANSRYYNSNNKLYHQALEIRLLYCVIELISAYFSFRAIPWRGEKAAVKYLEQNDPEFLATFQQYSASNTLDEKFKYYGQLFNKTFYGEYQKWKEDFVIPISQKNGYDISLADFWNSLVK